MRIQKEDYINTLLAALSLFVVVVIDYILPPDIIVATLYTVPVLIAAYRLKASLVVFFTLLSGVSYAAQSLMDGTSLVNLLLKELGFLFVAVLAVQISRQRVKTDYLLKELEKSRDSQKLFTSMIYHDLMQPITTSKIYLQLLMSKKNKDSRKVLVRLTDSIDYLQRLISDLRENVRLSSGSFTLNLETFNLANLVAEVAARQQTVSQYNIELSSPKKLLIKADKDRITQVLNNLISNAVKYSPNNKNINVNLIQNTNVISLSIADHGIGMTPTQSKALFEPFSRQYKDRKKQIEGIGLGLYITKLIIEAHQGKIWVESKKNRGSTFFINIPISL